MGWAPCWATLNAALCWEQPREAARTGCRRVHRRSHFINSWRVGDRQRSVQLATSGETEPPEGWDLQRLMGIWHHGACSLLTKLAEGPFPGSPRPGGATGCPPFPRQLHTNQPTCEHAHGVFNPRSHPGSWHYCHAHSTGEETEAALSEAAEPRVQVYPGSQSMVIVPLPPRLCPQPSWTWSWKRLGLKWQGPRGAVTKDFSPFQRLNVANQLKEAFRG